MSPATSPGGAAVSDDDSLLASLRYLFADIIGDEDEGPPVLPDACPDHLGPAVTKAIDLLIAYQSTSYAQLYIDRLKRFVGRRGVDDALLAEIARLMADRMAYEDAIRQTATKDAPWHVVPADNKWFTRLVIAETIVETLEKLDPKFPVVDAATLKEMEKAREALVMEEGKAMGKKK